MLTFLSFLPFFLCNPGLSIRAAGRVQMRALKSLYRARTGYLPLLILALHNFITADIFSHESDNLLLHPFEPLCCLNLSPIYKRNGIERCWQYRASHSTFALTMFNDGTAVANANTRAEAKGVHTS